MSWSPQQDAALKSVADWLADDKAPQVYRLFGYAGTGKTTLARELAMDTGNAVFAAFTGKAALVMRSKGCHGACTIHSLIYTPKERAGGTVEFVLNEKSDLADADLCVIDECSMVGEELALDLLKFKKKILVLGDPAQLPPVRDAGFFTDHKPDTMLTEVHRQARDNPIIRLSMNVREGRALELGGDDRCRVISRKELTPEAVLAADQVLVGMNKTRMSYNRRIRELKKITEPCPVKGERLVCLRNNRGKFLFNGGLWDVKKLVKQRPSAIHMILEPEDKDRLDADVSVHPYFFQGREGELTVEEIKRSDQFTFGYALTVHKSQGSQWPTVMLFDEGAVFRDDAKRWLYTGITRAAEHLTIVVPPQ